MLLGPALPISKPPSNGGTVPEECTEGKNIQVSFTFTLRIQVINHTSGMNNTLPIPNDIGKEPIDNHPCTRRMYTGPGTEYNPQSEAAVIHVASPEIRNYNLSYWFDIWDQYIGPGQVMTYRVQDGWAIQMRVNDVPYEDQNFQTLQLEPSQQIVFYIMRD